MYGKDFHHIVDHYANLIEKVRPGHEAAILRALASIFEAAPKVSVAVTCKKLQQVESSSLYGRGDIQRFLDLAPYIEACLEATAKKTVIDDFKRLHKVLPPFASMSTEQLTEALRAQKRSTTKTKRKTTASLSDEGIATYVQRLNLAIGNEQTFSEVFSTLKNDPSVKAPIAKRIAREFAKKAGRTKTEALSLIWERHASLVGAKARADATSGRTAG